MELALLVTTLIKIYQSEATVDVEKLGGVRHIVVEIVGKLWVLGSCLKF
jgi:hypothetical protein